MSAEPLLEQTSDDVCEPTLFDRLARLVPAGRQAEYYRVLAHTKTLSPDDEMLRILEAMGILALLTQETPQQIAAEREQFAQLLEEALNKTEQVRSSTSEYVAALEKRIGALPSELRTGLDPGKIAKLLGESLRQNFIDTGLPNTVHALHTATDEMVQVQKNLSSALSQLAHPNHGVAVQVRQANNALSESLESRARKIDGLLFHLTRHLVRVWMPTIATAAFALGCIVGIIVESRHFNPPAQVTVQPQAPVTPALSETPTDGHKSHKWHERQ
jgi:hypothetical protein